jgi:hypothetical protein
VRVAVFGAGIGAFLSFIGAFGADTAPLAPRTIVMAALSTVAGLLGYGLTTLARRHPLLRERVVLQAVVVAALMTPLMGIAAWGVVRLLAPARHADLAEYLLVSLGVSAALTSLFFAVFRPTPVTHAAPQGAPPARFLARLPAKLYGADLWAVSAEDHYLRVHTSRGEELILMRLADAIDELEGLEGAQTHRSWWVARAAIREVKRGDGRATIILPNEKEAPVSRTYARTLREAGWI